MEVMSLAAPSSQRKFTGCFLSAPISPRRTTEWYKEEAKINFSERSLIPFDWEENQGNPRKITDNEEDTVDDKQKVKSFTRVSHDSLPLFLCLKRSLPSLLIQREGKRNSKVLAEEIDGVLRRIRLIRGKMQLTLLVLKSVLSLVLYLQDQRLSILSSWINLLDHQAIIPEWEGCLNVNLGSSATTKLSGTCVVPMPALNMPENIDDIETWASVIWETKLSKLLEAAFLSPTNHEIVSFYFNGFVLRRRATQNRWFMLDIDSDDDEWHEGYGAPLGTQYVEEKEDFAMESPLHHQGIDKFNEEVHQLYHQEDASISDNDEDDNIDTREDGYKMNNKYVDKFSRCNEERLNVEDESCTPFELAHDAVISS
ncbi:hypothetical protein HID58_025740 [Brassica napus]|uniref:Uncharacterized protein n=1 Tax=Brassica napus TaxID=3708 RepID=A0ABQ8CLX7_BRANA|nr:hypothetical protein HID58_025740 [Brassica napus]